MISADETEIVGAWRVVAGKAHADAACRRIEALTHQHLKLLGRDASGWDALYVDPGDGRFWELLYPQSDLHGGGPPTLRVSSAAEVRSKYALP